MCHDDVTGMTWRFDVTNARIPTQSGPHPMNVVRGCSIPSSTHPVTWYQYIRPTVLLAPTNSYRRPSGWWSRALSKLMGSSVNQSHSLWRRQLLKMTSSLSVLRERYDATYVQSAAQESQSFISLPYWQNNIDDKACYLVSLSSFDWETAKQSCARQSMDLVWFDSVWVVFSCFITLPLSFLPPLSPSPLSLAINFGTRHWIAYSEKTSTSITGEDNSRSNVRVFLELLSLI